MIGMMPSVATRIRYRLVMMALMIGAPLLLLLLLIAVSATTAAVVAAVM